MAAIKSTKTDIVKKIQIALSSRVGRPFTQQEIVDLCLGYGYRHLEEIAMEVTQIPKLSPEKAQEILDAIDGLPEIPYNKSLSLAKVHDRDIYTL